MTLTGSQKLACGLFLFSAAALITSARVSCSPGNLGSISVKGSNSFRDKSKIANPSRPVKPPAVPAKSSKFARRAR